MNSIELKKKFESEFDLVGIIKTSKYLDEMKKIEKNVPFEPFETMVVLGLTYPKRIFKHSKTHLVPSFYTFGKDYHLILKSKIEKVMDNFPYPFHYGVDNHPHDERTAARLAGLGYFAKNQLIINKTYGSYIFLGIVFIDMKIDFEFILDSFDDCGTCEKCIKACPVGALSNDGYQMDKCMSYYNQMKKTLNLFEIKANYCLFGCDICQLVCPKNMDKGHIIHDGFIESGKEYVSIDDLFTLSNQQFKEKYNDMAYLWKGKTILMRNALLVMLRQKNTNYIDLIEKSLDTQKSEWYIETAKVVLSQLKEINKDDR
jgi:epoxyqueuosine reductase